MADYVEVLGSVPDGSEAMAACFSARDYHSGQWSQLYKLSSSGKVDDLWSLRRELVEAIAIADHIEDFQSAEDSENFRALVAWVDDQDSEGGI